MSGHWPHHLPGEVAVLWSLSPWSGFHACWAFHRPHRQKRNLPPTLRWSRNWRMSTKGCDDLCIVSTWSPKLTLSPLQPSVATIKLSMLLSVRGKSMTSRYPEECNPKLCAFRNHSLKAVRVPPEGRTCIPWGKWVLMLLGSPSPVC